jgi:decaprenyl-phosphate phosphoribosyltransferase
VTTTSGPQTADDPASDSLDAPVPPEPADVDLPPGAGAATPAGGADGAGDGGKRPTSLPVGLLKLARPKQWAKNVLVFAAPFAAGRLDEIGPLRDSVVAFVCFCLAAAGTYYINDARDVEADRLHPKKRNRPIATGVVPVPLAYVLGAVLLVAGVGLSFTASPELAATVAGYVALTTLYSNMLKHIAVVDMVAVAAGFVLRAVGGAAATHVEISQWFFIVTSFGSLFMVVGKRGAEAAEMGDDAESFRSVLGAYTAQYTSYLRSVTSSAVLLAYCQWTFVKAAETDASIPYYQLSILPFVMAVLRYALVLDQGKGSAPEEIILRDRPLQVIGLVWVLIFGIGVATA